MEIIGIIIFATFAFAAGAVWGFSKGLQVRKENKLLMSIQLDATQPVKITAKGYDKEQNEIDLSGSDLTITAEGTNDKNFGEVNDAQDTFNPGEAGATGVIKGSVTIDEIEHVAEVEVELVPGGLAEVALDFKPVEDAPSEE